MNQKIFEKVCNLEGTKKGLELEAMSSWVQGLKPWQVISHLTFEWEASMDSTRRNYEKFMRTELSDVDYFYAIERNPSRAGHHVHALWHRPLAIARRQAWADWFHRYGRARIEPVRSSEDVTGYCAKYVTKEGAWWNVKLLTMPNAKMENGLLLSPVS
jgi:hypothetical protein